MKAKIIQRQQQKELERVNKIYSVIVVTGPRQSGKTTLCKFILTGSSNFALMESVTQSLAGRSAVFSLLPLSHQELGSQIQKIDTDKLILKGGYPAVWGKEIPVQDVSRNYYNTYVERDVRQLLKIKEINHFQTFIKLCAGRIGSEFNASSLSNIA